MMMCRSCGEFVPAVPASGTPVPSVEECPGCGGSEFVDRETGERVRTD